MLPGILCKDRKTGDINHCLIFQAPIELFFSVCADCFKALAVLMQAAFMAGACVHKCHSAMDSLCCTARSVTSVDMPGMMLFLLLSYLLACFSMAVLLGLSVLL